MVRLHTVRKDIGVNDACAGPDASASGEWSGASRAATVVLLAASVIAVDGVGSAVVEVEVVEVVVVAPSWFLQLKKLGH